VAVGDTPVGTVTFLFTDIEGSTRLWQEDEASMRQAVARHDRLLRAVVVDHGGVVFSTMGDGLAAAFQAASAAVSCAVEAQELINRESWGTARPLRVRTGLHTGEAELREGDYFGTAVNRGARLAAVGHGGQILCSSATAEVADIDTLLVDLGEHRLRDLDRPMHVFQCGEGSFPPLRSLGAFPGNLPIQLTSFVGRQEEVAAVGEALAGSRLVTLTGTGGVGKTRLALQAAAHVVTRFPDGVWLCELAAAADTESMRQVVAAALGYTPASGVALDRGIADFVGSRRWLMVLDNSEHLLDPVAGLVETILGRCPNAAVLATSREALGVGGEQIVRLRPFPVPHTDLSLDQLGDFDATRLFVDRVQAAGADLTPEAGDGPAIAEICRRLDGIPLAIELAAARVIALAPAEIAAHLDERFRLLTGGRRGAVERQHTLRATIDWSFALLSAAEQTVFNVLGVFPASFDTAAAQAVAAAGGVEPWEALDALTSLVAKSLLNADRGATGTRYQMLESLRHYARERLDASGSADQARRCHARHYAAVVVEIISGLKGAEEAVWFRRFDAEEDNLRAAVVWGLDSAVEDDGELAMVILGESQSVSSPHRISLLGYAVQALERARRSASPYAGHVIVGAAMNAFAGGDFSRGRRLAGEAMQRVRTSAHPNGIFQADFIFGDPRTLEERLRAAVEALAEVEAGPYEHAQVHASVASMAAIFGNLDLARREVEVAIEINQRLGNTATRAHCLYAFGLAFWQSDPEAVQAAHEEYLQIVHSRYYDFVLPRVLALQAQLLARSGKLPAAVQALREGLDSAHTNGDRPAMAVCIARGAIVMMALRECETAAVFVGAVTQGVLVHLGALPRHELADYKKFIVAVQSELGDDRYTAATARGAAMTYEQICAFALAAVDDMRQN
jgi:predicted ATPase/class 3 adenylate cyclase